jgi:hypothetical protein
MNSKIIYLVSVFLIPLILSLEPVSSLYGAYYIGKKVSLIDIVIYVLIFIYAFINLSKNAELKHLVNSQGISYTHGNPRSNDYIYWLFYLSLIYPFLKYTNLNPIYVVVSVIIAICLLIAQGSVNSIGSHWCLYSNVISIVALFYPYIVG